MIYPDRGEIMKIDLTVLEEAGSTKNIDSEAAFEDINFRNQIIKLPELVVLNIDIYTTQNSFVFTGDLKGKLIIECSRCLKPYSHEFEVEVNKEIAKSDIEDLKNFDLNNMLMEDIYMTIPIKPLCSQDCKGICEKCGQNLNEAECDCEEDDIDPRLAKLNDFYDD